MPEHQILPGRHLGSQPLINILYGSRTITPTNTFICCCKYNCIHALFFLDALFTMSRRPCFITAKLSKPFTSRECCPIEILLSITDERCTPRLLSNAYVLASVSNRRTVENSILTGFGITPVIKAMLAQTDANII